MEYISSIEIVKNINLYRYKIGNRKELKHKILIRKIRKELNTLKLLEIDNVQNVKESSYKDIKNENRPCYLLNDIAIKYLSDKYHTDRLAMVDTYEKLSDSKVDTFIIPIREEDHFVSLLEDTLKLFNISGIRQYSVLNYRIDYYIPELNIAIEYDENNHSNYTYEQHEGRQKKIEKELGCRFIRVSDKVSIGEAIGVVLKEIGYVVA